MREYYTVKFKILSISYYCLWFTNDIDGYIIKNKKLLVWKEQSKMIKYCDNNIKLEEEITIHDVDILKRWLNDCSKYIDCTVVLLFWNAIDDLARTSNIPFSGSESFCDDVYNKLFYGNNLPTINNSSKKYTPTWIDNELEILKNVLSNGIEILESSLSEYKC